MEEIVTKDLKPKKRRVSLTENEVDDVCNSLQLLLERTNRMLKEHLDIQQGIKDEDRDVLQELLLNRQELFILFLNKSSDGFRGSLKEEEYIEMGFDPPHFDENGFLINLKDINQKESEDEVDNVIRIEDYKKKKKRKK